MNQFFGKSWNQWIADYSASHQHPINRFCHKLGIPMILVSLPLLSGGPWVPTLLQLGLFFFILGWILQFVGHAFERKVPEFFKDWRFLFVGLRWWWLQMTKGRQESAGPDRS